MSPAPFARVLAPPSLCFHLSSRGWAPSHGGAAHLGEGSSEPHSQPERHPGLLHSVVRVGGCAHEGGRQGWSGGRQAGGMGCPVAMPRCSWAQGGARLSAAEIVGQEYRASTPPLTPPPTSEPPPSPLASAVHRPEQQGTRFLPAPPRPGLLCRGTTHQPPRARSRPRALGSPLRLRFPLQLRPARRQQDELPEDAGGEAEP